MDRVATMSGLVVAVSSACNCEYPFSSIVRTKITAAPCISGQITITIVKDGIWATSLFNTYSKPRNHEILILNGPTFKPCIIKSYAAELLQTKADSRRAKDAWVPKHIFESPSIVCGLLYHMNGRFKERQKFMSWEFCAQKRFEKGLDKKYFKSVFKSRAARARLKAPVYSLYFKAATLLANTRICSSSNRFHDMKIWSDFADATPSSYIVFW